MPLSIKTKHFIIDNNSNIEIIKKYSTTET